MTQRTYPPAFDEDDDPRAQFKLGLAEALVGTFNESDWKKVSMRYHLQHLIDEHPRFLRSIQWGDPDRDGHVLDLVDHLYGSKSNVVIDLFNRPDKASSNGSFSNCQDARTSGLFRFSHRCTSKDRDGRGFWRSSTHRPKSAMSV
jgi:hypothetical protein